MMRALETAAQRCFTVEEYHRMGETGILGPDEGVELIRGVVRRMSPKNRAHVVAAHRIFDVLNEALKGRASVYLEAPLAAEAIDSEPEPDVMVCSNPDRTAYGTPRTQVLLVIEVAESSLGYDLGEKAEVYAEAGAPEYWVVDLRERRVVLFREPSKEGYRVRFAAGEGETVEPRAWQGLSFPVSDFLAPSDSGQRSP